MKLSDEVANALRTSPDLRRVLDRAWPATTAPALVRRLLTNKAMLAAAADGILSRAEQQSLQRRAARKADDEPWTAADLVLIDEADAVLGGRPRRFGHLVVDEAQDVSAMAWRLLARRSARHPSMTVLGDLAQSTAPGGQSRWDDVVRVLGSPEAVIRAELDVGYRVPEQILELANRLLPARRRGGGTDAFGPRHRGRHRRSSRRPTWSRRWWPPRWRWRRCTHRSQ